MPDVPPTTPVNRAVFLSYASQDRDAAKRICDALRSCGVEVWFDQEGGLEHGDAWDAKIRRQIKECLFFIPLISENTQARLEGYFRIEWDLAADRAQGIAQGVPFILPVTIDETREPDALVPDRFRKVQWMQLPGGVVSPDVLMRLLKLWSHRTGALAHEAARVAAGGASPLPPVGLRPGPARPLVAAAPLATPDAGGPQPKPVPNLSVPSGSPSRGNTRFGSLELGGGQTAAPKREVVKDEAYYLAEAQEKFHQGRYDPALRAYSKVLEYNAANEVAWIAQVRMLIELGELREAKLWAEKALQRLPNLPELLAAKAVVLARMADLDSALAFSDAAIEERGNTPYVWLARGDVLLARGEVRASYCFEQALTLGRSDWVTSWQASRIHSFHHSHALAHTYALQSAEQAPGRAVVWLQKGEAEAALGLAARASESLAQARLIDAECPGLEQALQRAAQISAGGSLWRRLQKIFK